MINIMIKECKEFFADKRIWIGIITVLIIFIIGTSYNKQNSEKSNTEHLRLGVINHDESTYSKLLVSNFSSSKTFSNLVKVTINDENKIKDAFRQGKLDIYIEVPKDFANHMMQLEHRKVKVTMNIADTTKAILFQNVLKSYEKYIAAVEANAVGLYDIMEQDKMEQEQIEETNKAVSINMILTALGREAFFSFKPVEQYPTTSLVNYYMSSILVIVLLYSGLYVGFLILRELELGTFTRLRTTKTLVYQLITVKMLLLIAVLTIVAAVAISLIAGKPVSGESIVLCLSMAMFCVCEAVFLSSLLTTNQSFILAGNLMIFFFSLLGGGIIPIQFLPQDMVKISKFTPNYYMLKEIVGILNGQPEDAPNIILLFMLLSICMAAAAVVLFEQRRVVYDEV